MTSTRNLDQLNTIANACGANCDGLDSNGEILDNLAMLAEAGQLSGDGTIVVDSALDETSVAPVQNRVIAKLIPAEANSGNRLADKAYVDTGLAGKADADHTHDNSALDAAIDSKVDKIEGKGLSTNDFTTAEKERLASLHNYDDTEIKATLETKVDYTDLSAENIEYNNSTSGLQAETVQSAIDEIKTKFNKTVLFIGDSYGDPNAIANPWTPLVTAKVPFKKYYTLCTGGHGFTGKDGATSGTTGSTLRWITDLTNFVAGKTKAELDAINEVYIIGGFNDIYSTYDVIKSYMSEFFAYAHSKLVNATFYLGMAAWCWGDSITTPNITTNSGTIKLELAKVLQAYSECAEYNCCFIGHLGQVLHVYPDDFDSSFYHPSAIGAKKIANALSSYIIGKRYSVVVRETPNIFRFTKKDGSAEPYNQAIFYTTQSDNMITATNFGNQNPGQTAIVIKTRKAITPLAINGLISTGTDNPFDTTIRFKSGMIEGKDGNGSYNMPCVMSYLDGTNLVIVEGVVFITVSGALSIISYSSIPADVELTIRIRPFVIPAIIC